MQRTIHKSTPSHNGLYNITRKMEAIVTESGVDFQLADDGTEVRQRRSGDANGDGLLDNNVPFLLLWKTALKPAQKRQNTTYNNYWTLHETLSNLYQPFFLQ
jgi:hypothetical protein